MLIFLVWWFYIRPRGRRNIITNDEDTTYTGGAATPPIGDYNQDGYDGYASSPRMAESAVPRTRNRGGRVRALAPPSYQDGLASVLSPQIDGYNQDGYDVSSPRMVESAVPRPRNRAGRERSLAPSSRQDGLASVAQSVVGGRPTGYA